MGGGLPKTTNWWGAFVIGLAGTILVTGIAPVMVTSLGAAAIPSIFIITVSGYLLCLFLAELSAMMPDRSGGSPAYAYPAFKDRWPRFAEHVNGFTAWAYWLGWFPVGPLNMILASFYIVNRFKLWTAGFTPIHTQIAWWTLGISIGGLLLLIPAIRGLRFGTFFATTLALLSMIPLTFLAISWIFHPRGRPLQLTALPGSRRRRLLRQPLRPRLVHDLHRVRVPADLERDRDGGGRLLHRRDEEPRPRRQDRDEPRGCLRCLHLHADPDRVRDRDRDQGARQRRARRPEDDLRQFRLEGLRRRGGSNVLDWLIAIMLILALILSALNAITGTARSLHQMSMDGQFPRFFQHTNHHGVPDRSMMFNIVCMIIVVFFGGAVEIYTFSNVGYLASFVPVLVGYYLLRKDRPNVRRPFKLPEWMKYLALALAAFYTFIYFYGGITYAQCACSQAGHSTLPYYFIGWACSRRTCRCTGGASATMTSGATAPMTIGRSRRPRSRAVRPVSVAPPGCAVSPSTEPPDPRRLDRAHPARLRGSGDSRRGDRVRRRLAGPGGRVRFSIARVHGTAFGFPSPGLLPTKSEWQEQRDLVARGQALRKGLQAEGEVVGTREAAARICSRPSGRCDAIVMAADPAQPRGRRLHVDTGALPGAPKARSRCTWSAKTVSPHPARGARSARA